MMKFYLDGTHPADPDPADPNPADPDPADPPTPAAAGATVRAGTEQMWSDVRRVRELRPGEGRWRLYWRKGFWDV